MSRTRQGLGLLVAVNLGWSALLAGSPTVRAAPIDLAIRDQAVNEVIPLQLELRLGSPDTFGGLWVTKDGVVHVAYVGSDLPVRAAVAAAKLSVATDLSPGSRFGE
jgi:hypothetical protein